MDQPRLLSFIRNSRRGYGLARDGGVVDLSARLGAKWPTLRSVIEAGALNALFDEAGRHAADFGIEAVAFDIPVPDPEKIICVGVNFPDRNEEYKDGQDAPKNMSLFVRFPRSFVGHGQPILRPPESVQFDYEGEIVIVIGRGGRRIPESEALAHVAGLSLANEGTLRDWVRHAKFNVTQGKNFDRSGAIGPWLVPFTHESQLADIRLTTRVNGELRQDDRTGRMIFSFRKIIAYISTFTTLVSGDTILCGTPTGAGARLDPPVWLKPGDVVEVEADGIGRLSNGVADEALP
ncbi:MAG: fumarylacetoacetate hydrolase family protein [Phyllobacteriaceae bacterium]|nr:fumarylacetoacetate hydrolase family protein [Phyllobacteriaceae bacterium]